VATEKPASETKKTAPKAAEPVDANEDGSVSALDLPLPDLPMSASGLRGARMFMPDVSIARWALKMAAQPGAVAKRAGSLAADMAAIAAGSSDVGPGRRDKRFADPAWSANPVLRRAMQAYLAIGRTAEELLADAELEWKDSERLKFVLTNLIAAAAPSNSFALSPSAWKAAIDTGGMSAVRGVRAFASDMAHAPHTPSMVEPDAFELGKDLVVTPGAVVARSEVCELIQYRPSTEQVRAFPLLMIPPMINKYYITDLAPGRSMLEFFVSQGYQVFVISWRNPDKRHRDWDINTYGTEIVDSIGVVREITGAPKVNLIGLCAGGIVTSMLCAHLAQAGQLGQISSLGLGVTLLDLTQAGTMVALMDDGVAAASALTSRILGCMDGKSLAEVFAWLRPDDLIWNYWVNNYLQGKKPPAFDILYWNADTTRLPAGLHRSFIEVSMTNALATPGTAGMLGTPVDLSTVTTDTYVVAGIDDHIAPWPAAYRSSKLLGGNIKFVLSTSGHIAAMVNPPTNPKATYRIAGSRPDRPEDWLAQATVAAGSWWPDYTDWLASRSGELKPAPRALGSAKCPVLSSAPGTYVLEQ